MEFYQWFVFIICLGFSLIPIIRLNHIKHIMKYKALSQLGIGCFIWGLLIFFQNVLSEYYLVYFSFLLLYPTIFFIIYLIYRVVFTFSRGYVHKSQTILFTLFAFINYSLAFTNPYHQLYVNVPYDPSFTKEIYLSSSMGIIFYIHTFFSYLLIAYAFFYLLIHLYKKGKEEKNQMLFFVMMFAIVFGIFLNIHHLFIRPFMLDPTFIFLSFITFTLYYIIYRKDFNLALINSSRNHILNLMREMYVIVDDNQNVIECSESIMKTYHIDLSNRNTLENVFIVLREKAILFEDIKEIIDRFDSNFQYLNYKTQSFQVRRFKREGTLILFYNETQNIKLLNEIRIAKSIDKMTGAYNRNYYEENQEIYSHWTVNSGIIMFDVNHLKLINDTFGHKAGDQLLIDFVSSLKKITEKKDAMIFRMGGDEFLYLEKYTTLKRLEALIPKIEKELKQYELNQAVGFSYGIELKIPQETFEETVIRADRKMYLYKEKYKNDKRSIETELKQIKKRHVLEQIENHTDQHD